MDNARKVIINELGEIMQYIRDVFMLKRTLFFTNPFHLSVRNKQLVISVKEVDESKTIPIEDIGFVVIDHAQITITPKLLEELVSNNVAVIFCDSRHHPQSMLMNLDGNHLQNEHFRNQLDVSEPLKKSLWKQVVEQKIANQAALLSKLEKPFAGVAAFSKQVKSDDADNREGAAARAYWPLLFGASFIRGREEAWPNAGLNYGYTILRAAVARALTGSGLLCTLGIHHHSRYNAFCLADDIMEPYRPYVDEVVYDLWEKYPEVKELDKNLKAELLQVLTVDTVFTEIKRPLMVGLSQTSASLTRCFAGEGRRLEYPRLA